MPKKNVIKAKILRNLYLFFLSIFNKKNEGAMKEMKLFAVEPIIFSMNKFFFINKAKIKTKKYVKKVIKFLLFEIIISLLLLLILLILLFLTSKIILKTLFFSGKKISGKLKIALKKSVISQIIKIALKIILLLL